MNHCDTPQRPAAAAVPGRPLAVRTSLSDPLRIDEVAVGGQGGRIGLCLCPGKRAGSTQGPRWERDLDADLDAIARWHAGTVLTLIEDHEFDELRVPQLGQRVRERGIAWHHLPIADYQPPDTRFEHAWARHGPALLQQLRDGGRVLVHCRGGLGRAGTVAARMLVELDVSPLDAIAHVRRARPGAIETHDQLRYVQRLRARASSPS